MMNWTDNPLENIDQTRKFIMESLDQAWLYHAGSAWGTNPMATRIERLCYILLKLHPEFAPNLLEISGVTIAQENKSEET